MLSRAEALEAAAWAMAREGEAAGIPVRAGTVIETPGWFVLLLEAEHGAQPLPHRLPPLAVDRRTGDVRRPFAAGDDVVGRLQDVLGPDEWVVRRPGPGIVPAAQRASDAPGRATAERAGLRRFRVVPAGRDSGDRLEAVIVGSTPSGLADGLAAVGVVDGRWPIAGGHARVRLQPLDASARITISGCGGDPWTCTDADVAVAVAIEHALVGQPWLR